MHSFSKQQGSEVVSLSKGLAQPTASAVAVATDHHVRYEANGAVITLACCLLQLGSHLSRSNLRWVRAAASSKPHETSKATWSASGGQQPSLAAPVHCSLVARQHGAVCAQNHDHCKSFGTSRHPARAG